jgi:hypothetical protein
MAVVQVQNVCDPTNTANVWVANFTGVPIDEITKRTLPYQVSVATAATLAVVFAAPALFGVKAFASVLPPAMADTISGLYAPASAAGRIAVGNDGTSLGSAAAGEVVAQLRGAKHSAFEFRDDPNATDCRRKRYAAYIDVTTSTFKLIEGTDLDVGLRLLDCGGWIVGEWHDHAVSAQPPGPVDARALAREGVTRLFEWVANDPKHAESVFENGLAVAPGDPPTYFYTLFKTLDGNMRAFVRAGGPAYDAGLRSGDIVNKLDGQYWWEYGTYQTQSRAYDGQPHSYEVERAGKTLEIRLGAPFDPNEGKTS